MKGLLTNLTLFRSFSSTMKNHLKHFSKKMGVKVEKLQIPQLTIGEGPHWDCASQSLYLVDIRRSTILRYDPSCCETFTLQLDLPSVGFVVPVEGCKNKFVAGAGTSLLLVDWDGTSKESSIQVLHDIEEPATNRVNDGKADPTGRLWFGTMRTEDVWNGSDGSLYSYTGGQGIQKHLCDTTISNGLAWNLHKQKMYFIDSAKYAIDQLDYCCTTGAISNRRVILDFKKNNWCFFPDGQTIDTDGNLWVACYGGSKVMKVDPDTGKVLDEVKIPAENVTSVAWGGRDLNELYVTSCSEDSKDNEHAGGTFRVTGLNAKGHPMNNFKLS